MTKNHVKPTLKQPYLPDVTEYYMDGRYSTCIDAFLWIASHIPHASIEHIKNNDPCVSINKKNFMPIIYQDGMVHIVHIGDTITLDKRGKFHIENQEVPLFEEEFLK